MNNSVGQRIEEILQSCNLKNVTFAKALNITPSYVTKIIKGKGEPSLRLIEDIAEKFNINEDWLLTGNGGMFDEKSDDIIIVEWAARLTNSGMKDSLAKKCALALAKLDETEISAIVKFAEMIVGTEKNRTDIQP